MSDNIPFEQTDQGFYAIHSPVDSDKRPETVSVTYDGVRYRFTDFKTIGQQSKVRPDVLLYETCEVLE